MLSPSLGWFGVPDGSSSAENPSPARPKPAVAKAYQGRKHDMCQQTSEGVIGLSRAGLDPIETRVTMQETSSVEAGTTGPRRRALRSQVSTSIIIWAAG